MEITWQTISLFIGIAVAISAIQLKSFDWLLKGHLAVFDRRFMSVEERVEKLESAVQSIRQDYIRREDWMRQTSAIEVKLDLLSARLDAMREAWPGERRGQKGGRDDANS